MPPCPCGQTAPYSHCCQPHHLGLPPASAEALMRARYCAFVLKNSAFLFATLHPSQRAPNEAALLQQAFNLEWVGLQVQAFGQDWVQFVAFYKAPKGLGQLHERSQFVYEQGQWWYTQGEFLPPLKGLRNQACPCGSGKKFKHCHAA